MGRAGVVLVREGGRGIEVLVGSEEDIAVDGGGR